MCPRISDYKLGILTKRFQEEADQRISNVHPFKGICHAATTMVLWKVNVFSASWKKCGKKMYSLLHQTHSTEKISAMERRCILYKTKPILQRKYLLNGRATLDDFYQTNHAEKISAQWKSYIGWFLPNQSCRENIWSTEELHGVTFHLRNKLTNEWKDLLKAFHKLDKENTVVLPFWFWTVKKNVIYFFCCFIF